LEADAATYALFAAGRQIGSLSPPRQPAECRHPV